MTEDDAPISNAQFAELIAQQGGGSVGFFSRIPVKGRGYLHSIPGAETKHEDPITEEDLTEFQKTAESHAQEIAQSGQDPYHGVWDNTQDVSIKTATPAAVSMVSQPVGEYAAFAMPGTRLSSRAKAGKEGTDILLHTADLGQNDVDPAYRPGALDINPLIGSFTKNQYKNRAWTKRAGTLAGSPISYGSILTTINKNRANRIREAIGRKLPDDDSKS